MATHTESNRKSGATAKGAPARDLPIKDSKIAAAPTTGAAPKLTGKAASAGPAFAKSAPPPSHGKAEPSFRPPPPKTETAGLSALAAKPREPAKPSTAKSEPVEAVVAETEPAIEIESRVAAEPVPKPSAADADLDPPASEAIANAVATPAVSEIEDDAKPTAVRSEASEPKAPAAPPLAPASMPVPAVGALSAGAPAARFTEMNETVLAYVRNEGEAALSHMQALARVTSPAELIRLQFGEFQRAADSSLGCISAIVRSASRLGTIRPTQR